MTEPNGIGLTALYMQRKEHYSNRLRGGLAVQLRRSLALEPVPRLAVVLHSATFRNV
jgi:hypothetical protein